MRISNIRLVVGVVALMLLAKSVFACQCEEYDVPYCERVNRADAIFVGTVKSVPNPNDMPGGMEESVIRFDVEQVFKGTLEKTVDVGYIFGTSCSWAKFEMGERWIVYGFRNRTTGRLSIPFCTWSSQYTESDEDVAFLNDFKQGKTTESVRGKVLNAYDGGVVTGSSVIVTLGNAKLTTTCNDEGSWQLAVPGPGKYKVNISLPFSAVLMSYDPEFAVNVISVDERKSVFEYETVVEKGLCNYRQLNPTKIDLKANASISGRLLDHQGAPVKKGFVYLSRWGIDESETLKDTTLEIADEDGNFSFVGLREGPYVVLTNPDNFPDKNEAYLRSYLPGVSSFAAAFVIELEQGKELVVPDFKLPKPLPTRKIEIYAVYPDGKPVLNWGPEAKADTLPSISIHRSDGDYLELADATRSGEGKYSLPLYKGFPYVIEISAYGRDGQSWNGFVRIPKEGAAQTFKMILKPKTGDAKDFVKGQTKGT